MSIEPQHRGLSLERWKGYPFDQQVLMIGNEMNRISAMLARSATAQARSGYERALRLTDLTIEAASRRGRRRELLRWRDLIAAQYVAPNPDPSAHREAFKALLSLTPVSARQIPLLLPSRATD